MEILVLVEPINGQGFRARCGEPMPLSAEGATGEEALSKLQKLIQGRLSSGAKLLPLEVAAERHPWLKIGPIFREDDPLVQEWKQIMEENRQNAERDPSFL
jgi:hypothetical protein